LKTCSGLKILMNEQISIQEEVDSNEI